ncbi:hypothetical protein RvY_14907-3 [Ramazzottius varieornatus]|uniref:Uncharacterized protein n=1 Tax=Ramazzottius varieornatus TaxID=947166 RepID=A0A1D1VSZ8_RAMVA|nr:hypothetical protein RvY_14907-3 [Ramazzottius varieornatus]
MSMFGAQVIVDYTSNSQKDGKFTDQDAAILLIITTRDLFACFVVMSRMTAGKDETLRWSSITFIWRGEVKGSRAAESCSTVNVLSWSCYCRERANTQSMQQSAFTARRRSRSESAFLWVPTCTKVCMLSRWHPIIWSSATVIFRGDFRLLSGSVR